MGKPTGFLETPRQGPSYRPVPVRLRDWREVYEPQDDAAVSAQASRCMDCGIPFCMQGCPLGNRIPAFNDLVYQSHWDQAARQLLATNNFPEFTGRLCPAPCESACVVGIADQPVTIERIEYEIIEHAFGAGIVTVANVAPTGQRVAVVGSGPAWLAVASQLSSVGHVVEVFERADAIGGLLRYGIPEFKMEKAILDRRLDVMRAAGVIFHVSRPIGDGATTLADLQEDFDAVVLAIGSTIPRLIDAPGANLKGVYPAMTYLEAANRAGRSGVASSIDARDRDVVILGGGDTGADCLGTAHRQGARSVTQIEIMDQPPSTRPADQPWPTMARLFKTTSAHEEGGERWFSSETLAFVGTDALEAITVRDRLSGATHEVSTTLVLIAAGFTGPEAHQFGLSPDALNARNTLAVDDSWRLPVGGTPVFACGDAVRGQSLIVWAIAEGRSAAAAVDDFLRSGTSLPAPVTPAMASW